MGQLKSGWERGEAHVGTCANAESICTAVVPSAASIQSFILAAHVWCSSRWCRARSLIARVSSEFAPNGQHGFSRMASRASR